MSPALVTQECLWDSGLSMGGDSAGTIASACPGPCYGLCWWYTEAEMAHHHLMGRLDCGLPHILCRAFWCFPILMYNPYMIA